MEIREIKKIELSREETENLIRKGLGISSSSEIKISMRIPEVVKLTITTTSNKIESPVSKIPEGPVKRSIEPGIKGCGNCGYPYPMGDNLFCNMIDKVVTHDFVCKDFTPKMEIKN